MTSVPRKLEMQCRRCGAAYFKWNYRPLINISLEQWTEEEIHAATTSECPDCGLNVQLLALVVDGSKFRILGYPVTPDRPEL